MTERLLRLLSVLEEKRTNLNTHQVDYIKSNIEKGWTEKQIVARGRQTQESFFWHSQYGNLAHRESYKAASDLFEFVFQYLAEEPNCN